MSAEYSDDATIVKGAARFDWTNDFGTYLSYSTGYKSEGVFNAATLTPVFFAAQPLAAETSQLWELGLRSQWLGNRLTLNLTGFLTKFENYQQQASIPCSPFLSSPMPAMSTPTVSSSSSPMRLPNGSRSPEA